MKKNPNYEVIQQLKSTNPEKLTLPILYMESVDSSKRTLKKIIKHKSNLFQTTGYVFRYVNLKKVL